MLRRAVAHLAQDEVRAAVSRNGPQPEVGSEGGAKPEEDHRVLPMVPSPNALVEAPQEAMSRVHRDESLALRRRGDAPREPETLVEEESPNTGQELEPSGRDNPNETRPNIASS